MGGRGKSALVSTSRLLSSLVPRQNPRNPYHDDVPWVLKSLAFFFPPLRFFDVCPKILVLPNVRDRKKYVFFMFPEQKFSFLLVFVTFLGKHNSSIPECQKLDFFILWLGVLKSHIIVPSNNSIRCSHHEEPPIVKQTPHILTLCIAARSWPQSSPLLPPVVRESMSIIECDLSMFQSFQSLVSLSTVELPRNVRTASLLIMPCFYIWTPTQFHLFTRQPPPTSLPISWKLLKVTSESHFPFYSSHPAPTQNSSILS